MSSFEMEDLTNQDNSTELADISQTGKRTAQSLYAPDDSIQVWSFTVASVMAILSIPLLFFPRFLLFLCDSDAHLTPLEQFLSNQLGVMLLVLATASIIAAPDTQSTTLETTAQGSHPLLPPLTIGAGFSALLAWNSKGIGSLGTFVSLGNGLAAAWGFWTLLFSGSSYISRKTGADKRTSTYLFGNKKAASAQKKEWKSRQKLQ
ncbi:SubName: Full=Uncharacterized protein {ECO:0000313/EMBL:CCA74539.1} [Serendipita indica DSM 11827]|uniref:Uncharacterized protein n=1 Tax=Serendipita indica (strain DSM 11827) TaxID=1109443 RepID=G4TTA1_SERID|nr:SubName: Full=Uncharacterized protein {ECO:0000313/EMBL:CCA74539.1} [Serendipita indica DSM 11827]CCA74539.1 hypothetical protein PIIN_08491 [Serendipita indica DSM 11827]